MKKLLSLFVIVLIVTGSQAAEKQGPPPSIINSRHIILPFVGVQNLNGETVGFGVSDTIFGGFIFPDTIITRSGTATRDANGPMVGLTYRFRPNRMMFVEGMLALILDEDKISYPIAAEIIPGIYTQRAEISISRSNTKLIGVDAGIQIPESIGWLSLESRLGAGYAWRNIKRTSDNTGLNDIITSPDAEDMFLVRGGFDFGLWRSDIMMLQASWFYTAFIPTNSEADVFGGFGWKFALFPIWSVK